MIRIDKFARLICAVSVFWGTTVFATDGVLEINQACAINGGCFPGDGPGFPVQAFSTVSGSTSFILTSDLLIEDVDKRGVQMGSNDTNATLDLNGFTIRGPVFCEGSGAAVDCDLNGIGEGIRGFGRVTVKNGTVIGFGNRGIYIDSGRIMRVTAIGNFGDGIRIGREGGAINNLPVGSLVSECIANGNNGQGIVQIHGIVKNS